MMPSQLECRTILHLKCSIYQLAFLRAEERNPLEEDLWE